VREIDGYVVIAKPPHYVGEILYGPRIHDYGEEKITEPLKTNGIVPFASITRVENAQRIARDYDNAAAEVARVHFTIPEDRVEEKIIERMTSIIVIEYSADHKGFVVFRGPRNKRTEAIYSAIPGAFLEDNGYETWLDAERALHVRNEVMRQATNLAFIAHMKLERKDTQGFLNLNFPSF
jgi:hypothetical protein